MNAIILAAGLGSRLRYLTDDIPKALIKVASEPLILRVIDFTKMIDVDNIVVVGGYKCQQLWETIKSIDVIKIENRDYKKGNIYSLASAKEYLDDDFILLNTDHLFPAHLISILNRVPEGIWAVSDFDRRLFHDDMKISVKQNKNGYFYITAISKKLTDYDGGYCGITIVKGTQRKHYLSALDTVLSYNREQAMVEEIFDELINHYHPPQVLDMSGIRWLEIDTQDDLANAERILRMKPDFLN